MGPLLFRRSTGIALARVANLVFFVMTATYCLLSYSAFASHMFIKAHLVLWLTDFVVWHYLWFWGALGLTALTITSEPSRVGGRGLAWGYLVASVVLGVVLTVRSVLPDVENNGRGLMLALAALAPPLWLAAVDHLATGTTFRPTGSSGTRVARACLMAGIVTWLEQSALIPWRLDRTGEIALTRSGMIFGLASSAVGHIALFALVAVVLFAVTRIADREAEYWLIAALSSIAIAVVTDRLVFAAIAFTGAVGWVVSIALGVTVALVWSGIARRRSQDVATSSGSRATAMDVWLAPVLGVASPPASICGLLALGGVGFVLINRVAVLDWDFVVQKLCVVVLWALAFAYSYGAIGEVRERAALRVLSMPLAAFAVFGVFVLAAPRLSAFADPALVPEFVSEGYVAVDPSYRLISALLHTDSPADDAFYAYLRANTIIQHVDVKPVDINFVPPALLASARGLQASGSGLQPLATSPQPRAPNIFLFVIDSLRRDYLSPYNPAVEFTPAIARFASNSVVFDRAFTRYGGTAFSVPAIWAGGMLLHKEYVKPFAPMNTLLKLLDVEGYRRFMSMDVIVEELVPRDAGLSELDRGVDEVKHRFCGTLDDLQQKIAAPDPRPVFAYMLPQDIHISHVRDEPVPAGKTYPGFEPHVASQIERMDGCFGSFVDFLRQSGQYDNSIVVLMSDHGDSLGEGLRWGHSSTMFPEVVRVPLIVHIPERLRKQYHADPGAIATSIDLTPSFYQLLGFDPANLGPLFGRPLFNPAGAEDADAAARRHATDFAVSSYGAVYALYQDNGTTLYIADGVNSRDYAYALSGAAPVRVGIRPADRDAHRKEIRNRIDELSRMYHLGGQTRP